MMTFEQAVNTVLHEAANVLVQTSSLTAIAWIGITLICYIGALKLSHKANGHPLLHPLIITTCLVLSAVFILHHSVTNYQQYTALIHWLLGPATVALALPMYAQWQKVRELGWRIVVAVTVAGVIAPLLAWLCLYLTSTPLALQMTVLAKSITTPLAMETSRIIGGIPALAAVFVITTGIVGAIAGPFTFRVLHITHPQAQGIALGSVAHAIGTARAIRMGEAQAAMASLGLCLNGIMTAIVLPLIIHML
ncbi:LrgB family protein [Alteromonas lipotrueiana]|uniref:LrgB family protein n=1 Tax=Alteromonas lipotrueiana TaxID=2803815 RepID=UPI001FE7D0A9|nr:LrgB family protein [Alteromonas lipotrueiana]|tara:strand:+ start:531 stop:1280 length:750 start_codon:yes stop_codon:yes gene_type:complete